MDRTLTLILIIALFIFIVILWRRVNKLYKKLSAMELLAQKTATMMEKPDRGYEPDSTIEDKKPAYESKPKTAAPKMIQPEPVAKKTVPAEKKPDVTVQQREPSLKEMKPASPIWKKFEKQFIENWTGIVGAIIMVLGVTFLAIYAALRLSPLNRFIMMIVISLVLLGIHLYLRKKKGWLQISSIIRSAAGAIILFACLGAGGIPGLMWIYDQSIALSLLVFGIALNVVLGFIGPSQIFGSFHVAISLAALAVAPRTPVTLGIAGIVALFGIIMSYRSHWEYHLIVTLAGFFSYHLYWYFSITPEINLSHWAAPRITGLATIALVGMAACIVHYRKTYSARLFKFLPFLVHLMNWFFMGIGFICYTTGSKWNAIVLAAAGLAAFVLSRRAKSLAIRWLQVTDTLVAEALMIIAVCTLGRWDADAFLITGVLHLEVFVFLMVMMIEKDMLLRRIGVILHYLSLAVFVIAALTFLDYNDQFTQVRNPIMLAVMITLETLFHIYSLQHASDRIDIINLLKKDDATLDLSVGGIFSAVVAFVMFVYLYRYAWSGYVMTALCIGFLMLRQKIQSAGLWAGLFLLVGGIHALSWYHLGEDLTGKIAESAIYGAPLFLITLAAAKLSWFDYWKKHVARPSIYLFTLHFIIYVYFVTNPISPFIPGVVWIAASLIYLELSIRIKNRTSGGNKTGAEIARFLLQGGYALILIFLGRHIMVHLQSELFIGLIKVRLLIEIFAILVLLYWATASVPKTGISEKIWRIHPLAWEILLVFVIMTIALEVPGAWHPPVWMILALVLFIAGLVWEAHLSRFRFYSILIYWTTAFYVAFISSSTVTPSSRLADQPWIAGLAAQLLMLAYTILFYKRRGLENVAYPWQVGVFRRLIVAIHRRHNIWIFYPLFISLALFLFWSFDRSILTLLWVAEAFGIFILSLVLRENHFRYISMGGLAVLVIRIIVYDLSQTGTLTRALVLIGSGGIMLLINILYTKYRDRFSL
ncbi:MAG: hypothetical protein A2176_14870 [Spirochaetes bacterium RBG_13_51_14]|nr:MAG: hypothetical protein A2176_14870 [Spirochaetes bacterium RBG_13_51_14]